VKQLRNFKNENNNPNGFDPKSNPAVADALKKYDGMSEDELINQLLVSVRAQRANGTYNAAQYEKLQNVITLINSEDV
jgi:surfactin synthase thioesterase subunit